MTVSLQPQEIYEHLVPASTTFTNALRDDIARHFRDTNDSDRNHLEMHQLLAKPDELKTVGVVFALLGLDFAALPPLWTVRNLADHVRGVKDKSKLPIFFLDEVLPHYDRHNHNQPVSLQLRLARNLLRAVGLVAVLMGTNSCAANFVSAASYSRCGEAHPWCKLITHLPVPNDMSLRTIGARKVITKLKTYHHLRSILPYLEEQFRSCIPWFIALFVTVFNDFFVKETGENPLRTISAVEFLDMVLCGMAQKVYDRKSGCRSQSFLRAQFCYHLEPFRKPLRLARARVKRSQEEDPSSTPEEKKLVGDDRTDTPAFVASHFASLDDSDCDLFVAGVHLSKDRVAEWVPTASFQRAKDDSFLYLMLGGGNQSLTFPSPFALSSSERMTTRETFLNLIRDHNKQSKFTTIITENCQAVKLNGADLEVTAAVALEIASHKGGVGGIGIADFLLQLTTELLPSYQLLEWSGSTTSFDPGRLLGGMKVPYLSSESDSWPTTFRGIDGVYCGDLHRTKDQERIDLKVYTALSPIDPEISAECKNYKTKLNKTVICEILTRIPKTSRLHLVICTHLQSNYWKNKRKVWEEWRQKNDLEDTAILKVVKQKSQLTLEPLFVGSVPNTRSKFVIFFPFQDWSKLDTVASVVDET